jgi:hypothetical protein
MFNNNKFEKLPIFTFVKKESFRINFISLKQIFIEFLGPYGSIKKLFFIKENNFLIEPYNNTANFDKFIFFSNLLLLNIFF